MDIYVTLEILVWIPPPPSRSKWPHLGSIAFRGRFAGPSLEYVDDYKNVVTIPPPLCTIYHLKNCRSLGSALYSLCEVRLSVSISENAKKLLNHYILIIFANGYMATFSYHCVTAFVEGQGFAEHPFSRLWLVSENASNSLTVWYIWIQLCILNYH